MSSRYTTPPISRHLGRSYVISLHNSAEFPLPGPKLCHFVTQLPRTLAAWAGVMSSRYTTPPSSRCPGRSSVISLHNSPEFPLPGPEFCHFVTQPPRTPAARAEVLSLRYTTPPNSRRLARSSVISLHNSPDFPPPGRKGVFVMLKNDNTFLEMSALGRSVAPCRPEQSRQERSCNGMRRRAGPRLSRRSPLKRGQDLRIDQ
jgi:hypothetical protein